MHMFIHTIDFASFCRHVVKSGTTEHRNNGTPEQRNRYLAEQLTRKFLRMFLYSLDIVHACTFLPYERKWQTNLFQMSCRKIISSDHKKQDNGVSISNVSKEIFNFLWNKSCRNYPKCELRSGEEKNGIFGRGGHTILISLNLPT